MVKGVYHIQDPVENLQVRITLRVPHHRDRSRTLTFGTRASLPLVFGLNHAIYNP